MHQQKQAKKSVKIAAATVLSMVILISMAVNIYHGVEFDLLGDARPAMSEFVFFGWWFITFGACFLLYAVSRIMCREK